MHKRVAHCCYGDLTKEKTPPPPPPPPPSTQPMQIVQCPTLKRTTHNYTTILKLEASVYVALCVVKTKNSTMKVCVVLVFLALAVWTAETKDKTQQRKRQGKSARCPLIDYFIMNE
jgi:hypothetical protein